MLDPRLIREDSDKVRTALKNRGTDFDLDGLLKLDQERRVRAGELDSLKGERNAASEAIGALKRQGKDASEAMAKTREIGDRISTAQKEFDAVEQAFKAQCMLIPNVPDASVPLGKSAADNPVLHTWGEAKNPAFPLKHHLDFGVSLGLYDFERGSKITGRGFPIYTGWGAKLERALVQFFLDQHTEQHGMQEVLPPFVVNKQSMIGTGQLPKFEEDMYCCTADELYLVPTAEVPVTNMHADEVLDAAKLPMAYCAYTPCFRREAGSWGKETRGFLRLHQFNKVEMVMFAHPDKSWEALESLRGYAENLLQKLELHYRVITLCTGDMGFGSAKTYDLEVWAPGEKRWLECSSVSNFTDFQARRANIKTRHEGRLQHVHTLNGSGLATPRILVALLECYQTADGGLDIPKVLQPYLGGVKRLLPNGSVEK
jgi:seryl-tRNA synthetase